MRKKQYLYFFLLLLVGFSFTVSGMIQCSFEDRIIELAPGQRGQLEIKISNPDPRRVAVRAYLGDWQWTQDGEQKFYPLGTLENSLAGQIKLAESLIILEPGQEGILKLAVDVSPEQRGSRTAMVFVEGGELPLEDNPEPAEIEINIRVTLRYGIKIYAVAAGTQQPQSKFTACTLQPPGGGKIPVVLDVENTGNIYLKYRGQLEVRTFQGDVLETVELKPLSILPGGKRRIQGEVSLPSFGEYLLLAVLDYGNSIMAAEAPFVVKGGGDK